MEPKFILKILSPAVGFAFLAAFVLSGNFQAAKAAGSDALSEVYMAPQAGGKGQQKKPAKAAQKGAGKVEKAAGKNIKKQTKTNQGKALGKARAPGQLVKEEAHRLKDMPKEARPGAAKRLRGTATEQTELERTRAAKETQKTEEAGEKTQVEQEKAEEERKTTQEKAQKEVEEAETGAQEAEEAQQEARKKMEERAKAVEKERAGAKKKREEVKKDRR